MSLVRLATFGSLLLALVVAGLAPATRADEDEDAPEEARPFARAPAPEDRPGPDADLYAEAVAKQGRGAYRSARRLFWKLLDQYPDSPYAAEAEDRSGPNAFLGIKPMGATGPQARRIDVALMGDGYLLDKQDRYDKHCEGQLEVLLRERLYEVYRPYFNFWQFNLASEDKGVDEPEPPPPDDELEERRRARGRKRPAKQYNTALDCKAAGPQGQVWANPLRVWHYLAYLDGHDSLAIVFAQMGQLGMGGMGIATTGPRGVVVHEFGHAFLGLLDEYAVNPGPPQGMVEGPNATTQKDKPPWQHFLDAKVPGVDVLEGGATFKTGVWRPAGSCAMNTSAGAPYCPVCLEQGVLRLYERVSPIDEAWPPEASVSLDPATPKTWPTFAVLPMQPAGHDLEIRWIVSAAPQITTTPSGEEEPVDPGPGDEDLDPFEARLRRLRAEKRKNDPATEPPKARIPIGYRTGMTLRGRGTAHDPLPEGRTLKGKRRKDKERGRLFEVTLPADLPPGRHVLTAVVWDAAKPAGERRSWVLQDPRGLLEDRWTWSLTVSEREPVAGR
ncbi:MAG: M64 family metallo-endopeptidase [Planctomycetota bacterium]|nr:M64 family metallo-endopeptidase [Planctomycetota bacterium]